ARARPGARIGVHAVIYRAASSAAADGVKPTVRGCGSPVATATSCYGQARAAAGGIRGGAARGKGVAARAAAGNAQPATDQKARYPLRFQHSLFLKFAPGSDGETGRRPHAAEIFIKVEAEVPVQAHRLNDTRALVIEIGAAAAPA